MIIIQWQTKSFCRISTFDRQISRGELLVVSRKFERHYPNVLYIYSNKFSEYFFLKLTFVGDHPLKSIIMKQAKAYACTLSLKYLKKQGFISNSMHFNMNIFRYFMYDFYTFQYYFFKFMYTSINSK